MYHGHATAAFFSVPEVERTLHELAKEGGDRLFWLIRSNTPIETGNLRASWTVLPVLVRRVGGAGVGAATNAYIVKVVTEEDYAPYVEHGTGLFSPERRDFYDIRPRDPRGWLVWRDRATGQMRFAKLVRHPGSPGQAMVRISVAKLEHEIRYEGRLDSVLDAMKRRLESKARRSPKRLVRG